MSTDAIASITGTLFQSESNVAGDTRQKGKRKMTEIPREATAEILKTMLKTGKVALMNRNAIENAVRYLTPIIPEANATQMGVFYTCGECGSGLRSYDKFCPECGMGVDK